MRIKIQQFLFSGTSFSWESIGKSIGREFLKKGHQVDFVSTNGIKEKHTPNDLIPYIKEKPSGIYDMQLSYTVPHNFPRYLANGNKNRFGIYNFGAAPKIPPNFIPFINSYCDKLFPSSNFSKQNFLNSGIKEEKLVVIPHGIDLKDFESKEVYPLKTKKKYKILLNIATPHLRKNVRQFLMPCGFAKKYWPDMTLR